MAWSGLAAPFLASVLVACTDVGYVVDGDIKVGQAWTCAPTDDLPAMTYVVGRIDQYADLLDVKSNGEDIVVVGVSIRAADPSHSSDFPGVAHMPMKLDALGQCGETLSAVGVSLPRSFQGGFETWLKAAREDKADIWTWPVLEAYTAILTVLRKN